jgi:hypothetical protein
MQGQTYVYYEMAAESSLLQHELLFCSKDFHSGFKILLVYGVIYFRITSANILFHSCKQIYAKIFPINMTNLHIQT